MPTGCTINRFPAVDAGGGAVGISDTRSSASATAAEDKSTHRDNLKPIWGCYCDNGTAALFRSGRAADQARPTRRARHFEGDTRPPRGHAACGCDNGTAALFRSPSHGPIKGD